MSCLTFASVYLIILTMCDINQGAMGLSITSTHREVGYCGTEKNVTLPCLLSNDIGRIQIEWYYIHSDGSTSRVMRVSSDGEVMAGDNYKGRIHRGDSASLVLTNPKYEDAGSYRCEVLSAENPCCPKTVVNLTKIETGSTCSGYDKHAPGKYTTLSIILFSLDIILAICCIATTILKCRNARGRRCTVINCFAIIPCCICCIGAILLPVPIGISYPGDDLLVAGIVLSGFGIVVTVVFHMTIVLKRTRNRRSINSKSKRDDAESSIPLQSSGYSRDGQKSPEQSKIFGVHCKEMTDDRFVPTRPYNEAHEALVQGNSIWLVGGPGEGKTFILQRLVSEFCGKYECVQCSKPGDVEKYIAENPTVKKIMFVFDNAFLHCDMHTEVVRRQWVQLEKYLKSHRFIFDTRHSVWADCKEYLGGSQSLLTSVVVSSDRLTVEDKRKVLSIYLDDSQKLTDDEVEYIANISNPIAYVQCCKLVSEALLSGQPMKGVADVIFHRPISFLRADLEKLSDMHKIKYDILCLIALCGGKIPCRQLDVSTPEVTSDLQKILSTFDITIQQISESVKKLIGDYIETANDTSYNSSVYRFIHDAVFEAVILVYSKKHIGELVKCLISPSAVNMFRPQVWTEPGNKCVVNIPQVWYTDVTKRFSLICIERGTKSVFQNPIVKDEFFQRMWINYLETSKKDKSDLMQCNGNTDNCVTYNANLYGAAILYEYLNSGTNCKCKKRQLDTPKADELNLADTSTSQEPMPVQ